MVQDTNQQKTLPNGYKPPVKSALKSKTLWVGVVVSLYGVVCLVHELATQAEHTTLSFIMITVAGILMILMRLLTHHPVVPNLTLPQIGRRPVDPVRPPNTDDDLPWNG